MTHRRTKKKIEKDEKLALRQRILDVAIGARVRIEESGDDEFWCLDETTISRFIPALKEVFEVGAAFVWETHQLHHFESIESAVDWLYRYGARA